MKDYIYICNDKGEKKRMEAVIALDIQELDYQYIAYKDEDNDEKIYIAKVKRHSGELDTNFTEEERKMMEKILEEQVEE